MRRWVQFLLFTGASLLLAWFFNESSEVAGAKMPGILGLFGGLFDSPKPKVKDPEAVAAPPQPNVPPPTKQSETDAINAAKAEEERKAMARRAGGASGTVLTSSLNFDDSDTNKNRSVKKTVLGAGA